MDWIDLKKRKPRKGIKVLVCDEDGDFDIVETDNSYHENKGCVGEKENRTFEKVWRDGNGTRLRYWAPLELPAEIKESLKQ